MPPPHALQRNAAGPFARPRHGRAIALSLVLLLSVAIVGCGLGDLESRMDQQTKRIKILDEENKYLGWALEIPSVKGADGNLQPYWPFDFFLRVPREITPVNKDNEAYSATGDIPPGVGVLPLFKFSGSREGTNLFVAAGIVADGKPKEKEGYREHEFPPDAFRTLVRGGLRNFLQQETKNAGGVPDFSNWAQSKHSPLPYAGNAVPMLTYDSLRFQRDNFDFYVYIHQSTNRQIALVFQLPKETPPSQQTVSSLDWCLKSLDMNPTTAASKRRDLSLRRR